GRLGADGYALGQATSGRFDRDIERWLFDGPDARAGVHGTTSGGYASLAVEAGRHLHRGAWRLTPYLGADHVRMRSDGFEAWGSALRPAPARAQGGRPPGPRGPARPPRRARRKPPRLVGMAADPAGRGLRAAGQPRRDRQLVAAAAGRRREAGRPGRPRPRHLAGPRWSPGAGRRPALRTARRRPHGAPAIPAGVLNGTRKGWTVGTGAGAGTLPPSPMAGWRGAAAGHSPVTAGSKPGTQARPPQEL